MSLNWPNVHRLQFFSEHVANEVSSMVGNSVQKRDNKMHLVNDLSIWIFRFSYHSGA